MALFNEKWSEVHTKQGTPKKRVCDPSLMMNGGEDRVLFSPLFSSSPIYINYKQAYYNPEHMKDYGKNIEEET